MPGIIKSFLDNWQIWSMVLLLLIVLSITGRLRRLLRDARKGLGDIFTIEGFLIFCGIMYLIYLIYLKVAGTL